MTKYKFAYGGFPGMTVTVKARDEAQAREKAFVEMDRRYAKKGEEPPVAWTFTLLESTVQKTT